MKELVFFTTRIALNRLLAPKTRLHIGSFRYVSTTTPSLIKLSRRFVEAQRLVQIDVSTLLERRPKGAIDWTQIRDKLTGRYEHIQPDPEILNYCLKTKQHALGLSYIAYMQKSNLHITLYVKGLYFRFFYISKTNADYRTVNTTKTEEDSLLKLYEKLRFEHKLLPVTVLEDLVCAFSVTSRWEMCLKFLDEIKDVSLRQPIPLFAYSCVIAAAFRANHTALAWQFLHTYMTTGNNKHMAPVIIPYIDRLEKISSRFEFLAELEHLLDFYKMYNLQVDEISREALTKTCRNKNIRVINTTIGTRGICENCDAKLKGLILSNKQIEELKDAVLNSVIVGQNINLRSNPAELKDFQEFMKKNSKYEIVIDGLNVGYSGNRGQSSANGQALRVASMIKYFVQRRKKVALFGRSHMSKWNKEQWNYVKSNADVFLTESLSQDDPFLLYAALNSGSNVTIISNDLMRQHLFRVKEFRLKSIFSQWLNQSLQPYNFDNRTNIFLKVKPNHLKVAQKQNNCWHLPCAKDVNDKSPHEPWLCIEIDNVTLPTQYNKNC